MAASLSGEGRASSEEDGARSPDSDDSPGDEHGRLRPGLLSLPGEVLELVLCSGELHCRDIVSVTCTCRRLRDVCAARGAVWRRQLFARWPSIMKYYNQLDLLDWLEEYKTRHKAGLEAQRIVAAFSKSLIIEHRMPCEGFNDLDTSGYPVHFIEDELLSILQTENGKCLTQKYCAKKILYFMRQEATICKLKGFLQRPVDHQDILEGAVLIDQYCNPLKNVSLENIQKEIEYITRKVKVYLSAKNSRHPSLSLQTGVLSYIEDLDLQRQALDALNHVLFTEMMFKGNVADFYNPLNSYIHQYYIKLQSDIHSLKLCYRHSSMAAFSDCFSEGAQLAKYAMDKFVKLVERIHVSCSTLLGVAMVLINRTGIPISLSVLYLTLAERLGVHLEPVNFPHHFMLRWCQGTQGGSNITDYVYVDAFGCGKCLTAKECEYMIGQHVTEEFYAAVSTKEVLQRMVGNLLNLGKRESKDRSFMLLRVSLDLYLAMYPDSVQHLLLQARLYFHLGIWPEKVLDILQNIQALDPSQHGAVAYLVQHTLEHIERRKEDSGPSVKLRSSEKDVCYSVGLLMRHKRYNYRGVIFGWDPICMMPPDWIENLSVHQLPQGANQPFYSILLDNGSCSYVAQENLEPHPEPGAIEHPDIAHYFTEFAGNHYIANKELQLQYPEDTDFTIQQSLLRQSNAPELEP